MSSQIEGKELKIVYLSPKELIPYEKNPRMNDNGVKPVKESIKKYGFKNPIVIDKDKCVVCGHTRLKAALELGMDSVPCIIADDLSEAKIRAFRIADNKTSDYSIWDNRLLLEELEALSFEDVYTGFDISDFENIDILNENDKSVVDENEEGVMYELVCRSMDKEKVERIQKVWDEMGGNDG